jgi:4-diphosphocytidyl-2-C-methyl-D-erythritol kinase
MSSSSWVTNAYGVVHLATQVHEVLSTGQLDTQSAVCFTGWSEKLRFRPSGRFALFDDKQLVPGHQSHPVRKAIAQLRDSVEIGSPNYRIDVSGKVPRDSGISIDAAIMAQTLHMINKLEGLGLADDDLLDIGQPLHPDIIPCLHQSTGLYQPAQNTFTPQPLQPNCWMLVVQAPESDLHEEVHFHPQFLMPNPDPLADMAEVIQKDPIDEWQYVLGNEMEPGLLPDQPQLGNVKDQMYEFGAFYAAISQLGPAIVALFDQDFVAQDAYHHLVDLDHHVHLTPPGFSADWAIYEEA